MRPGGERLCGRFDMFDKRPLGLARGPDDVSARQLHLKLALRADRADLFLILRSFGEHAQIEHRARAARKIGHHKGVVEDVGRLAIVALLKVVHILAAAGEHAHRLIAQNMAHQVEEMAAFLHQRAAGVAVKAVPIADLGQKGKAVLANAEHLDVARLARMHPLRKASGRRHEAVLQAHPKQRIVPTHRALQSQRVVNVCAHRLF